VASALTGKVAVVTGAGTGIGPRIAKRLVQAGADVLLHHHGAPVDVERIAAACRVSGRHALVCDGDFAQEPGLAAAVVEDAVARLGRVDILVNSGRIINIGSGSVHARQSAPQRVAYEVSKGALHALTFSAAVQLGQHGITVNCIAPGAIWVERYAELESFDEAWHISRTPVGRVGRTDDVAAAVVFLAGDDAGFISSETLFVDGGMTRRMPLVK
jgi:NAD(P)-dependent dehydrogenase (short-subunit alcohol dehydrogenase family)